MINNLQHWVVEFGCNESVIRTGSFDEVNSSDDLDRLPINIRKIDDVKIKPGLWIKNGCLRCELVSD